MNNNKDIPQFVDSDSFMSDKDYLKWLFDLKKRIRVAQLKAAINVNVEMLKFYWGLGKDICEKQRQFNWGSKIIQRLSLDLRTEFPQTEGFSRTNLYYIKHWYEFFSAESEFVHQPGGQIEKINIDDCSIPDILLRVP